MQLFRHTSVVAGGKEAPEDDHTESAWVIRETDISNFKWTQYFANTERVVPPDVLRTRFRGNVAPLLTQVATLGRKIQNLRRTRDLLLPRLLSGQLDVEAT